MAATSAVDTFTKELEAATDIVATAEKRYADLRAEGDETQQKVQQLKSDEEELKVGKHPLGTRGGLIHVYGLAIFRKSALLECS